MVIETFAMPKCLAATFIFVVRWGCVAEQIIVVIVLGYERW
jgi:hypothetical protein